ncbi:MAG: replication-associated recombination protein A [Clostridiaceae bacterium]|nr:replication-associated recombination protein A [Clostridiaceae bacterium]
MTRLKSGTEYPENQPLAARMAPRNLDDFVGQEHIVGPKTLLRRLIKADRLGSIILFGPPGTGKTSLARVIANTTEKGFRVINAVTSGVADIKQVIAEAQNPLLTPSGQLILFIDEIHRFNKAQQDALLPSVEQGSVILIGATTENPYFTVNKALVSRTTVFRLLPLDEAHIKEIIDRALTDKERGLGNLRVALTSEAETFLTNKCNGDARIALNALELAVLTIEPDADGVIQIGLEDISSCMQIRATQFDATGEGHYNTISAMIKSMRGSDPDAAIYYLARAIHGGEDPAFLARRVVIQAAEEVGMANPTVLQVAMSAYQAVREIGMPEARIILAQAVIMVATSPKSNASYLAIDRALKDVAEQRSYEIPLHLRNPVTTGMAKDLGYGVGYKYAHDYPGHIVDQEYLPPELRGRVYYEPTENGYEQRIAAWLNARRQRLYGDAYKSTEAEPTEVESAESESND